MSTIMPLSICSAVAGKTEGKRVEHGDLVSTRLGEPGRFRPLLPNQLRHALGKFFLFFFIRGADFIFPTVGALLRFLATAENETAVIASKYHFDHRPTL